MTKAVIVLCGAMSLVLSGCNGENHGHSHADGHKHERPKAKAPAAEAAASGEAKSGEGDKAESHDHEHAEGEAEHDHAHHHAAPHGGTLVEVGDHVAHLEFLIRETDEGYKLVCYVLDGGAEKPVRLEADTLTVKLLLPATDPLQVDLKAVASDLTGETTQSSSQFEALVPQLKEASEFGITVSGLTIKGVDFEEFTFPFPQGNE